MRTAMAATTVAFIFALTPGALGAASPPNDNRANAQALTPPASVTGTTVGSTLEPAEPTSSCGAEGGTIWYLFTAARKARIVADFQASGDLDAIVDVFHRVRSQSQPITCDLSDKKGHASVSFRVKKGETYLIRVGQLQNSVSDTFRLDVLIAGPPARPPGRALPPGGVTATLDRTVNISAAWAVRMTEGRTYRIHAYAKGFNCMRFRVFPPHTSDFSSHPSVKSLRCGGYTLFTPGPRKSGRFSILAQADTSTRGVQRYHLQVAPATRDDTAPGIFTPNYAREHGSLQGSGIDVADLYRFDVLRRSDLKLTLSTRAAFHMTLLSDGGRRLTSGSSEIDWRIKPGRYFVEVRAGKSARGRYVLKRVSRTITRTRVSIDGQHNATAAPGATAHIGVDVSPSASGPVTVDVERFDPVAGWQFFHRYLVHASGGKTSVAFRPPSVGRWRAKTAFLGTRADSPSVSGWATLLVAQPLPKQASRLAGGRL